MRYCGEVRKWVLPWIKPRRGGSVEGTLAREFPVDGRKARRPKVNHVLALAGIGSANMR